MFKHKLDYLQPFRNLNLAPYKLAGRLTRLLLGVLIPSLLILSAVGAAQSPTGLNSSPTLNESAPASPAPSQPFLPSQFSGVLDLFQATPQLEREWIRLNGTRLFQIAGYQPALSERRQWIQTTLQRISRDYVSDPDAQLNIEIRQSNHLPVIYISRYAKIFTVFWAENERSYRDFCIYCCPLCL